MRYYLSLSTTNSTDGNIRDLALVSVSDCFVGTFLMAQKLLYVLLKEHYRSLPDIKKNQQPILRRYCRTRNIAMDTANQESVVYSFLKFLKDDPEPVIVSDNPGSLAILLKALSETELSLPEDKNITFQLIPLNPVGLPYPEDDCGTFSYWSALMLMNQQENPDIISQ